MHFVPHSLTEVLGGASPDLFKVARQFWGLAVRSERALRSTAPLWSAQQAAWGEEAVDLLASIAKPASWLSEGVRQGSLILPASANIPLARLLLSCAATELKVARVAGLQPGMWIFDSMDAAIFQDSSSPVFTSVISLLLPRLASSASSMPNGSKLFACNALTFLEQAMCDFSLTNLLVHTSHHMSVLLNHAVAEVTDSRATFMQASWGVMAMVTYATYIANASFHVVQQRQHGQLSPVVRARLAQPILMLFHSKLLVHLTSLQHVVVNSNTNLNLWRFPEGSSMPPVHLLPTHMQPDAEDSDLAMLVGLSSILFSPTVVYRMQLLLKPGSLTCEIPSLTFLVL